MPSVSKQTRKDFTWLVFFDSETPEPFRTHIAQYGSLPNCIPVFQPRFELGRVQECIRTQLRRDTESVITSRLDNDDAISPRYIEEVRKAVATDRFQFVNFLDVYQYASGKL